MTSKKPPIYELRIALDDVEPCVWRLFRVDPLVTLPLLHLIIQHVMGWNNCHMHCFNSHGVRYGMRDSDLEEQGLDERRYRLRSLVKSPGDGFTYTYDFGDSWGHSVTLERTVERSRSVVHPKCIAGENACPPEDVGGVHGYDRLRLVLANPRLEQHAELREWAGQGFDPADLTSNIRTWRCGAFEERSYRGGRERSRTSDLRSHRNHLSEITA
jgi:hypothetical protein